MEFIDLKRQQALIRSGIERSLLDVLDSGQYILGKEVNELEDKLADYVGCGHCIGVSSGTDALLVSLISLGISKGDEIVTTPFSYFATIEVIIFLGAKPVFVDICPDTFNIDPSKIEEVITDKTKAIIPVSLFGQCPDFDKINSIASKYDIPVIEDAAQSFGAQFKNKKSSNLSTIGCTSFFPSKPLGGYGDSGACFTNDSDLAEKIRKLSTHGQDKKNHHSLIGLNARMDTMQAAILLEKFKIFPEEVILRMKVGKRYTEKISALVEQTGNNIVVPTIKKECKSVFSQYTIKVQARDHLIDRLKEKRIPYAINYPLPLHKQAVIKKNFLEVSMPIAEELSNQVISLPMHPYLSEEEQDFIISTLGKI